MINITQFFSVTDFVSNSTHFTYLQPTFSVFVGPTLLNTHLSLRIVGQYGCTMYFVSEEPIITDENTEFKSSQK